jgi:hypothetical protein
MQAGRIAKLDKLAKEYVSGGKAADVLEKIEEAAKESKAEYVDPPPPGICVVGVVPAPLLKSSISKLPYLITSSYV